MRLREVIKMLRFRTANETSNLPPKMFYCFCEYTSLQRHATVIEYVVMVFIYLLVLLFTLLNCFTVANLSSCWS